MQQSISTFCSLPHPFSFFLVYDDDEKQIQLKRKNKADLIVFSTVLKCRATNKIDFRYGWTLSAGVALRLVCLVCSPKRDHFRTFI